MGQFVITRAAIKTFKRQFRVEGEDYLLDGMLQFRHMQQLEFDLDEKAVRSAG